MNRPHSSDFNRLFICWCFEVSYFLYNIKARQIEWNLIWDIAIGSKIFYMECIADRITIDDNLCNGKPTVRGKRITVQTVLEFLSAGENQEEILRQYPSLEMADIVAC